AGEDSERRPVVEDARDGSAKDRQGDRAKIVGDPPEARHLAEQPQRGADGRRRLSLDTIARHGARGAAVDKGRPQDRVRQPARAHRFFRLVLPSQVSAARASAEGGDEDEVARPRRRGAAGGSDGAGGARDEDRDHGGSVYTNGSGGS